MTRSPLRDLSRRERQLMNALYAGGPATVTEIVDRISSPPSYSAVRATLRVLEEKGFVEHEAEGRRYLYRPRVEPEKASRAALTEVVKTYFEGSALDAAAALLRMSDSRVPRPVLERLAAEIDRAREEGR